MRIHQEQTPREPAGAVANCGLVLAIDTCGPVGSVALGRLSQQAVAIHRQIHLEGRSYSASLISAVAQLLTDANVALSQLCAFVVVNGPGSFTGIRVALSAVKGLAEVVRTPVLAASRLEVLASKAGVESAALDAHRQEVFLRCSVIGQPVRELLAGRSQLAAMAPACAQIAVCDEDAASLLVSCWPASQLIRTEAPTAADALALCAPKLAQAAFEDLPSLDANYLRRSDAEIFGNTAHGRPK